MGEPVRSKIYWRTGRFSHYCRNPHEGVRRGRLNSPLARSSLSGTILPGITRDSVIINIGDMGYGVKEDAFRWMNYLEATTAANFKNASEPERQRQCRTSGASSAELQPIAERKVGPAVWDKLLAVMTRREPDLHGWIEIL
jgi:hypothetical protein